MSSDLPQSDPVFIITKRQDGLGERIGAMINAIRLADMMGTPFRMVWRADVKDSEKHVMDISAEQVVLPHSVKSKDELFLSAFLDEHAIDETELLPSTRFPLDAGSIEEVLSFAESKGAAALVPISRPLERQMNPELAKQLRLSTAEAFARIGFAAPAQQALDFADEVPVEDFAALHLRSGDIVFGSFRKSGPFENKVINPSVAAAIIERLLEDHRQVVLFGQDVEAMRGLQAGNDRVLLALDLSADRPLEVTQQALFEIKLMSHAEVIVGAGSGFATTASMVGNKRRTNVFDVFPQQQFAQVTLADLEKNESRYQPLVAAFAYWQAYCFGGATLSTKQRIKILRRCRRLDPANLRYLVTLASLLYKSRADVRAEKLLSKFMQPAGDSGSEIDAELLEQFGRREQGKRRYTHQRDFTPIKFAAKRPDNSNARALLEHIEALTDSDAKDKTDQTDSGTAEQNED